jgi:hypothetical protein
MPAGPLVVYALLHLVQGQITTYELGVQGEVRGYARLEQTTTTQLVEVEADPRLALQLETRELLFSAAYAPRLWASTSTGQLESINRGILQAKYKPDPLYQLLGSFTGVSGLTDLLAPAVAGPGGALPGPIQAVGAQTSLRYLFAELKAGLDATPTARSRWQVEAAYVVDGGADASAQLTYPQQRGARGTLAFDWRTSVDDRLETAATTIFRSFVTTAVDPVTLRALELPSIWITTLMETWRRTYSSGLSTWAGAGAAFTNTELRPPVIDAGLQYLSLGGVQRLRLSGRYGPLVDAVSGNVYERADVTAAAVWAPSRTWRLSGDLSAGLSLRGQSKGGALVSGELRLTNALTSELDLTLGFRGFWQHPPDGSALSSYQQWGLFVSMAYLHRGAL